MARPSIGLQKDSLIGVADVRDGRASENTNKRGKWGRRTPSDADSFGESLTN
jgi:hypothetical protein